MNKKLVKTIDLKPGMISVDMGYVDIILTVDYDPILINNVCLKFLRPDSKVGNCCYPSTSKVTIYDPS